MPTQRYHIRHSQNFLRSRGLVERLLDRSSIGPADLVLEIGPGPGIITGALARRCGRVLAVERDPALAARLRGRLADYPHVSVRTADFLDVPLPPTPYKVFANIPFALTADIVRRLAETRRAPEDAYLVVQREAARRFLGTPDGTLVAALLAPRFALSIDYCFARRDFDPAPQVEAVLLRMRKRGPPLVEPQRRQEYRDFVCFAFTAWRPTLFATLAPAFGTGACRRIWLRHALDPALTPRGLAPAQWLGLFDELAGCRRARQTIAGAEARLAQQQMGVRKIHRTRSDTVCSSLQSTTGMG